MTIKLQNMNQLTSLNTSGASSLSVLSCYSNLLIETKYSCHKTNRACKAIKENMVLTIEPGLYIEGVGGVRFEDTIVITKTGLENFYPHED